MALTYELDNKDSPVRQWFERWLPNAKPLSQKWYAEVKPVPIIRPHTDLRIPGTVGTAFDYRLRYYLALTPLQRLVAARGLRLLDARRPLTSTPRAPADALLELIDPPPQAASAVTNLIPDFERELAATLIELAPVGRTLDDADEELLCRYCYALALFEELYRAGLAINSPLFRLESGATLADLLGLAQQVWVDDLGTLSRACVPQLPELARKPLVLNPTFAGSVEIGGADADLIASGCLIEVKTTIDPKFTRTRLLYQLLGYVFLDYEDTYGIHSVGVYLSRQSLLVRWRLDELLATLLDRQNATVDELRLSFRRAVIAGRRV